MDRRRLYRIAAGAALALAATSSGAADPAPGGAAPSDTAGRGGSLVADAARGDAAAGRALFSGAQRARNGGAACGACHALGGQGVGFSASLGPDLSSTFAGMAPEALDGLLQDFPFPTMTPIFAGHALTPGERADLAAFLVAAGGGAPAGGGARVAIWAGLVAGACLAALGWARRARKASTRAELLASLHGPGARR